MYDGSSMCSIGGRNSYGREAQSNLLAGRAKGAESAFAARTRAQTRLARGFHAERARPSLKSCLSHIE